MDNFPDAYTEDIYDWVDDEIEKAGLAIPGRHPSGSKKIGRQLEGNLYVSLKLKVNDYLKHLVSDKPQFEIINEVSKLIQQWQVSTMALIGEAFEDLYIRGMTAGIASAGVKPVINVADKMAMEFIRQNPYRIGERIVLFSKDLVEKFRPIIANSYTPEGVFNVDHLTKKLGETVTTERYKLERIVRTETATVSNLGRILGWFKDPYRFFYEYNWNNVVDPRTKPISIWRGDNGPYSFFEICFLWENQEQLIGKTWFSDQYNQRALSDRHVVWTPSGTVKIKDLEVGTKVYSIDESNGSLQTSIITGIEPRESDDTYIEITCQGQLGGTAIIRTTRDHPFYTTDGWKLAEELTSSMELFYISYGDKHKKNLIYKSPEIRKKQSDYKKGWHQENRDYWMEKMQQVWDSAAINGWKEKHRQSIIRSWEQDPERKLEQSRQESDNNRFLKFKRAYPLKFKKLCENRSLIQREKMADPEFKAKVMSNVGKALSLKPNRPESKMGNLLAQWYPDKWEYAGDFSFWVNGKNPDFICKEDKLIIEIYGDYWHREDDPEDRIALFREVGYDTIVIWESELVDENLVKNKVDSLCSVHNGLPIISVIEKRKNHQLKFVDLECRPHRNFILKNGIIAHNCSVSRSPVDNEMMENRFLGGAQSFRQTTPLGISYLSIESTKEKENVN